MSLYLVKHSSNDWRLHREDGTEIGSPDWTERPSQMDMVEALADEHNGASILGKKTARCEYTEIVTSGVDFRNVDANGQSELPW